MRELSQGEVLAVTGLLKMEKDGLAFTKAVKNLITDDELKEQVDAGILAAKGRIKGIQQFVNENQLLNVEEVE